MPNALLPSALLALLLLPCAWARAQSVKLVASKDVWVSAHPDGLDTSMGKTTQLKLKGNTEVALLDFDTSSLQGRRLLKAELWMHDVPEATAADKERLGLDPSQPDCLRKIGLSTLGQTWEEGSQTESYQPDPIGATYREASRGRPWAYPGSQLWAVVFGNGDSLHAHADREYVGNGWWKVVVDPRLLEALVSGASHGLVVEDESSPADGFMPNNYLHSRESGEFAPYLLVEMGPRGAEPPASTSRLKASPAPAPKEKPLLPLPSPPALPAGDPPANGQMRLWAFPEITLVDPVTGEAMFEPQSDLRRMNPVWNGKARRLQLNAARGEIVAFQLAVERTGAPLRGVRVEIDGLRGLPESSLRTYRMWYLPVEGKWYEEYALPLSGRFDLPASDNAVPGQMVQAVYVDIAVPSDASPGMYHGRAQVSAEGVPPLEIGLDLRVYPVSIPPDLSFNAELNAYGPPGGEAGSDYFYAVHRLAHYHRCTLNSLGYSQSGKTTPGYAPALAGAGAGVHITDWDAFDRIMGPLLDGSAFRDNPRRGVPVKAFYLPLSEHWPLSLWDYYAFTGDPKSPRDMARHALKAPPIEQAFSADYPQGWRQVARQFAQHIAARGWSRTDFQAFLNNKPFYGGTWWTLDEPMGRDDWQALRFWAGLFKQATADLHLPNLRFRGDISRPWWQYDQLDGLMDTIYYNSEIFDYPQFAHEFNRRIPDPHVYGAANEIGQSDHQTAAWCLKAFTLGLNGVLPWQSIGAAENLRTPDQTALLVPGDLAGYPGPVASLRVFALRRGAQDVELLRLLARKHGWTEEQMGALIASRVPLGSEFRQQFPDEAAAAQFGTLSAQGFTDLKYGLLELLAR